MIFQIFLIGALTMLGVHAMTQRRRSGPLSYLIIFAALVGIVLVMFPDASTMIARMVGIGRGADLVFYVFMVTMFAAVVNIHLRLRAHDEHVTRLARELALSCAREPSDRQARGAASQPSSPRSQG